MKWDCKICGCPDHRKPMCFRMTDVCCERHRKILAGEVQPNQMERQVMSRQRLEVDNG